MGRCAATLSAHHRPQLAAQCSLQHLGGWGAMSQAARVALPIVLTRPGGAGRGKLFVLFLTAFHGGRAGRARPTTSRCQLVCVSGKMRQGGAAHTLAWSAWFV